MDNETAADDPAGGDTPAAAPAPAPSRRPRDRRPRDMVISLLVLLVPVVLLIGGYQVVSGRNQPVAVDPAAALAEARTAGLGSAAPAGLGPDWVLVSAVFRPGDGGGTLRLGYATPDGGSVQLVRSTLPAQRLLPAELSSRSGPGSGSDPGGVPAPVGTVPVAGESWQRYVLGSGEGSDEDAGEQALVWLRPDRTAIVIGTATQAELRTLAEALPAGSALPAGGAGQSPGA